MLMQPETATPENLEMEILLLVHKHPAMAVVSAPYYS